MDEALNLATLTMQEPLLLPVATPQAQEAQSPVLEVAPQTQSKRPKKPGKRKAGFRMDTPPWPVRAIWELATEQDRQEAYQMGVQILEHWLGRMSRKALAEKLNLPPLRVWQLSQQALSGMVVALMSQPKRPPQGTPLPTPKRPDLDELKDLRKEVNRLREEKKTLEDLLVLLKDMPGQGETPLGKGEKTGNRAPNPMSREGRSLASESQQAQR